MVSFCKKSSTFFFVFEINRGLASNEFHQFEIQNGEIPHFEFRTDEIQNGEIPQSPF